MCVVWCVCGVRECGMVCVSVCGVWRVFVCGVVCGMVWCVVWCGVWYGVCVVWCVCVSLLFLYF